jgi:hypothetical protein
MDGESVGVGEVWVIDGFELKYPGDYDAPGYLAINCRCVEVVSGEPIGFEEDLGDEEEYFRAKDPEEMGYEQAGESIANSLLSEKFQDFSEEFKETYFQELRSYQRSSRAMNNRLRFGWDQPAPLIESDISTLTKAIESKEAFIDKNIVVFRGVMDTDVFDKMSPGLIFEDKGFVSATFSEKVAESFQGQYGFKIEIFADKGTKGIFIPSVLGNTPSLYESEFVFQRGSKFKVISLDRTNRTMSIKLLR